MRVRINFKGQSKGIVADVTIESDGKIDQQISNDAMTEAVRVFEEANRYAVNKTMRMS